MVMQASKRQLNRIFASWVLAGFWLLALIGMSAVTAPYDISNVDHFATSNATATLETVASTSIRHNEG